MTNDFIIVVHSRRRYRSPNDRRGMGGIPSAGLGALRCIVHSASGVMWRIVHSAPGIVCRVLGSASVMADAPGFGPDWQFMGQPYSFQPPGPN